MNLTNRTLFIADNLEVMRGIDSDCVDLIYLDPPFNSKKDYEAADNSIAAGASFKDVWDDDDVNSEWETEITEYNSHLYQLIQVSESLYDKSMKAYLLMLSIRMIEMHRILKPTGSIYLHCDPTASHYLKLVMDVVFEKSNFRNEIIWQRRSAHNSSPKNYGRIHDTIFFYSKNKKNAKWNRQYDPHSKAYIKKNYCNSDKNGRYRLTPLIQQGVNQGESSLPWRNFSPASIGKYWAAPLTGTYAQYIEKYLIPNYKQIKSVHDRLNALDEVGVIHYPKNGGNPRIKQYLDGTPGRPNQDIITNIKMGAKCNERTGYPTQKPIALLERIIKTSSNEGDLVLDPFCGCATACVAAENLDRQWVGIDISNHTEKLAKIRFKKEVDTQMPLFKPTVNINVQRTPPTRSQQ